MRLSFIVAVEIATAVGISVISIIHSPVRAQGMPPGGQGAKKPGEQTSIKEAAGQLKTDAGKTKDDVKAMDVNKAKQDVGQVNKDVQALKDRVKDMPTNPFGK
jgi:uncharacterized protein YjbJ (UPF0337 family)